MNKAQLAGFVIIYAKVVPTLSEDKDKAGDYWKLLLVSVCYGERLFSNLLGILDFLQGFNVLFCDVHILQPKLRSFNHETIKRNTETYCLLFFWVIFMHFFKEKVTYLSNCLFPFNTMISHVHDGNGI